VINRSSQQPRNPTDNSLFPQIRTCVITHETTGILPCAVAEEVSYIVYHHAISPFRRT
jgi:hypothetical protein